MSNDNHQLAGDIAEIKVQLAYLISDVKSLHKSVDNLREELRGEMTSVRADTAVVISRQNGAIDDIKKKSPELATGSWAFTTD